MKIGILTFHRSYNYGAFMQCFSFFHRLSKDFPDCDIEVVDFTNQNVMKMYETDIEKKQKSVRKLISIRNSTFIKCQEELKLSKVKIVSNSYDEIAKYLNDTYDVVVVGSDAVWNWTTRGFPNIYFLKDYHGRKLSYAASAHGLVYQNMSESQKQYLNEAFSIPLDK